MCFSGLETLIFTLEFGNNWVLCQINWVSIAKFLKIIGYLLKTFGYFTWILLLSLGLEIDHEVFSMVILPLRLIQEDQLSVSGERTCTVLVNRLED